MWAHVCVRESEKERESTWVCVDRKLGVCVFANVRKYAF